MIHRRRVILAFLTLLLIFASFMYFERDKNTTVPPGELFISQYRGYVAGYVNDTVRLDVYWIKSGSPNFSGVFGVRNLPPCLSTDGITGGEMVHFKNSEIKEQTISVNLTGTGYSKNPGIYEHTVSVNLKLRTPGRCIMDGTYLMIQRGNNIKRLPLGNITFEIYRKPTHPPLKIPSYIAASIGPEPSRPMLQYTLHNPFNESVEILDVVFEVPGLRVSKLQAPLIPPGGEANLTVITENTTRIGRLYIIRPIIIYKIGDQRYSMPAEAFYYATVPDEKEVLSMLTKERG